MLAVITVILIVAVVALPAVTSLSKSAARRNGVSLTMAALDQVRAQAVSQSANCFFVFANGDPSIPSEYRYRSFAVFQETYIPPPADKPEAAPYHLLIVKPWTKLPEGVSFRPDDGSADATEQTVFHAPTRKFPIPSTGNSSSVEVELPYIEFNSFGAVELDSAKPLTTAQARVKLFEGFIGADGVAVETHRGDAASKNPHTVSDETLTISLFTGRAKREDFDAAPTTPPNAPG